MNLFRKVATAFLSVLIAVTAIYAPLLPSGAPGSVPRAHAYWGVFDTNVTDILAFVLNSLAWAIAKAAVRSMTQSIVTWINSGFEGSPAFATDLRRNLRQVADAHVGLLVQELRSSISINSPYLDRVIGAATAGYLLYSSRDLIAERLKYTLANYVTNEAAYLRGNFNEGGFSAWMSGTFTCGNDSFCALSSMEDQMQREIAAEVDAAANDYLAGGGLFSWRCNCPEPPAGAAAEGDAADANLSDANPSAGCSVCTPGSVLEGMLIEDANSPLHELQLADSFNEIIGALAMQMVNQVMGGGGLLGTSRPSGGGGRSYLEQVARESGAAGPRLVSGLLQTISSERQRVRSYKSAWQKIGEVAARALPICQLRGGTHLPEARYEVERSQKAIERADKAVQALDDLRVRLSSEMALPDGARTSVVQLIADDYNCLIQGGTPEDNDCKTETPIETGLDDVCPLSSATLPSAQESGCISGESTDTSGAPGATQTLYTRLKGYAEGGC